MFASYCFLLYFNQETLNKFNELIDKDFNKLVNLLYRIDISEKKLKIALQNQDKTISSGKTIAKLIIERQLQKLEFRKKFSKKKIE